ncbi:MAG: LacI family DNA-binding transcriptional regulator, partial [Rhizobium pusense]|nr:LacI family DNA-binding transcriptional regulator [Agrobacterium pusense]
RHMALERFGQSIPIVYFDSPINDTTAFVGTDNQQSFGLIVDYLCRSGEPPCYFGMPQINANAANRLSAYNEAMERLNFEPRAIQLRSAATWDFERFAFEEANRLFERLDRLPSRTILCANDRLAFGVIAAAWQRGLKIGHGPENDLRIAGHDDHPLSEYACPPITTVAQNYNEIGRLAIELLLRKLDETYEHKSCGEQILLKAELMLRHSA